MNEHGRTERKGPRLPSESTRPGPESRAGISELNTRGKHMTADDLEKLDDQALEGFIEQAQALLKTRKAQRKQDAIEAARARLAEVGLSFRDVASAPAKSARKRERGPSLQAGQRYVNPADPKQVWMSGRGRRPAWVKALEKKGQLPDPG